MAFLKFMTVHRFSRFDTIWILIAAIVGERGNHYLAALGIIFVGAIISGILELIASHFAKPVGAA